MWLPVMAELAKLHTVIVPDLRGAGGSAKPEAGYERAGTNPGRGRRYCAQKFIAR